MRYLSADEARRLVNACSGEFRRMVQAAILTGCRYSELTRLTCGDYNPDSRTLAIRLAKGRIRHVVLTDDGDRCFAKPSALADTQRIPMMRSRKQVLHALDPARFLREFGRLA